LVTPRLSTQSFWKRQVWMSTSLLFGMPLDGMTLCPLVSSPSNFFAIFGRWMTVFPVNSLEMNTILLRKLWVTTSILMHAA
jgi:hypothetical protein